MRKIVFIHPQGHNWLAGQEDLTRIANVMPPHGLMMLSALLSRHGFENAIVDCYAHPQGLGDVVDRVLSLHPDAVGFSTTTSGFPAGYRIAGALKKMRPDLPVIFGGVHPTSIWERILKGYPHVDMIVVGEGEMTILELAQQEYRPSDGIRGLAYRDPGGEIRFTGERELIRDLDVLPYPAYDKLAGFPKAYPLPIFNYPRSPAATFITSRGCPYACSYCDRSVFKSTFRFHSAAYLLDHLVHLKKTYGIRHVNLYDDNFLLLRRRVEEFCERKLSGGLKMTFNCIGRADRLDRDLLKLMKKAGCWMINIGVESGDEAVISPHRSHSDLDRIREVVAWIREAGIRAKGLFMLGIPGETEASAAATLAFALENRFDDANLTKFTPFPGAPVYASIGRFGAFTEDWEKMNCIEFVFIPAGFTKERLERLYVQFYRTFYGRPAMLRAYGAMLWKSPESCGRLLKNLPKFLAARAAFDQA